MLANAVILGFSGYLWHVCPNSQNNITWPIVLEIFKYRFGCFVRIYKTSLFCRPKRLCLKITRILELSPLKLCFNIKTWEWEYDHGLNTSIIKSHPCQLAWWRANSTSSWAHRWGPDWCRRPSPTRANWSETAPVGRAWERPNEARLDRQWRPRPAPTPDTSWAALRKS